MNSDHAAFRRGLFIGVGQGHALLGLFAVLAAPVFMGDWRGWYLLALGVAAHVAGIGIVAQETADA